MQQTREAKKLKDAVRYICRKGYAPAKITFNNNVIHSVWKCILALESRGRGVLRIKDAYQDATALSLSLASAADEEARLIDVLLDLLLRQTAPDACAAAVLTKNKEGEKQSEHLYRIRQKGLPHERGESALSFCIEMAVENLSDGRVWGYHLSSDNSFFDFSAFGIALCLLVPLDEKTSSNGYLWVGFRNKNTNLLQLRKEWLQALVEHAAASLNNVIKSREKNEKNLRERDFLLGISHDLRSPGNRALFAARELLNSETKSLSLFQREQVETIEKAIEEQLDILGNVLDYARHQRGFLEAMRTNCNIRSLITPILFEYAKEAELRSTKLIWQEIPSVEIKVDSRQFRRMLGNLLSNAIKYGNCNDIEVKFELSADVLRVKVCDNGIGISADHLGDLFKGFKRGKVGQRIEGVGLGLAMTKALCELNAAKIYYEPNYEKGSIFTLEFLFSVCTEDASELQNHFEYFDFILAADDDPAAVRYYIKSVRTFARRIAPASSIKDINNFLQTDIPDLIISDLHLQDGDITELLLRLPDSVGLIVISGDANQELLEKVKKRPISRVLEKPADRDELQSIIKEVVQTRLNFR